MDENRKIGDGLDDAKFIATREVILGLLDFVIAPRTGHKPRNTNLMKTRVDLACDEIGLIWGRDEED